MGQYIAYEMDSASLPTGAGENSIDSCLQTLVGVTSDQMNPFQASFNQSAQKLANEGLLLAGTNIKAQYCAATVTGDFDCDDHGQTNDAMVLSHFQVQSIKPDINILVFKWTMAKVLHQFI